uniref:Uncharacterized protein n=1 Tax=Chromera velia CCMP2878 TaxID=1169474 RepID=A0A0G4FI33_9ALVE|eukprot:Cvel_3352.t1-p1 / transcript=Cvel_3352.t1 / gene=Cvel_3352 / organism=Chromera_velia_CCMP2878 / gene_product=hypothetical protein / transcript_product=hypothetical protein / location=Cvel_scaffold134:560-1817(-) / protein_length=121 / sequence_SO=supercontig / SO=protein_coding / is_pseudo=false
MCARGLDDALILSCDHNLCLGCAAVSLRRSQAQGNGRGIYCQLCGAHTVVDGASAQTLLEQPPPPGQAVGGGTAMGAMGGPPMHGGGAPMGTAAAGGMPGSYGGGADPSFGGYGMANRVSE